MKKINLLFGLLFVFVVTMVAYAQKPPEKVTFDDVANKQPAVTFDHAKHSTKLVDKCETCHHDNKGLTAKDTSGVKPCRSCHLNPKDDAPSMSEMSPKKNPMHVRCMGCHKENKKGPTKCKECHAK